MGQLSVATTLTVLAATLLNVPALPASATTVYPHTPAPAAKLNHSAPHAPVAAPKPDPALVTAEKKTVQRAAAGFHTPRAGTASVTMPTTTGGLVRAGSLPVRLGWAKGYPSTSGAAVTVSVASPAVTKAAGVDGMLVSLSRSTGLSDALPASMSLDYSSLANGGGDYADRLTVVEMPTCALTTPQLPSCQTRTPVKFTNDLATHTLTVQASLPAVTGTTHDTAVAGAAQQVVFAAQTAPSSGGGDFTATSLSASSTWQSGGNSGDFSWSYPLRVPPAAAGPAPGLAITYDSQSLDGRLPANNNQPSWIGDGFDLQTSYIERSYDSCSDEGVTGNGSGDECWKYNNATMVLNGQSTQLILDSTTGVWRPQGDDGAKIILATTGSSAKNGDNDGETWTVTATDGTQYVFGLNELPGWATGDPVTNSVWTVPVYGNDTGEPCHASTFAASSCAQAWRWNLDYVVDPNGNTETYWYTPEYNYYAKDGDTGVNGTKYTRGGYLSRIDYGQTSSNIYTSTAPDQVKFTVSERCVVTGSETCTNLTSSDQADWPDVPFDEICAASTHCTASQTSPTFFSTKRLTNVTTQYWTGAGTTYQQVDSWDLSQGFPATGDGSPAALFLNSITHTGLVGGSLAENSVSFGGIQLPNRVDTSNPNIDPLIRWRVHTITTETGSVITIGYQSPSSQCAAGQTMPSPDTNTLTCYPVYWTPLGYSTPQLDWFQKYPVNQVLQSDPTGGSPTVETDYTYANPAWHYDDSTGIGKTKYKTWDQWRGFKNVTTTQGAPGDVQTKVTDLYYQGMDGDKLSGGGTQSVKITDSQGSQVTDSEPFAGRTRESITYNGAGGAEVSGTITTPFLWKTATSTQSWGTVTANIVEDATVQTRTDLAAGGTRTETVTNTYDTSGSPATGLLLSVDDTGDQSINGDETCTRTTYAQNPTSWIMNTVDRVEKVSVACGANTVRPDNVVSDDRTEYDGLAFGAAPTKANPTQTERLLNYTNGNPNYQMVSQTTFDSQGRPLVRTNGRQNATTMTYTPATGGPLAGTTVTSALNQTTTTTVSPAWGSTLSTVDANNKRIDEQYDPLGRRIAVWQPTRSKASGQNPNTKYVYTLSNTLPSTVQTESLNNNGSTYLTTSITFYDAMLRSRQVQSPAPQGGRTITQTDYNSLGRAVAADSEYTDASSPSTTMANVTAGWPKRIVTGYDGAGRTSSSSLYVNDTFDTATDTTYGGDRTTVTPPAGGVATTTITDIRGNTTELDDYNGSTPTGSYSATKYTYTPSGKLATLTDAAGNVWQDKYDLQGHVVETDNPDSGKTTTTYDADNNVTSTTDAAGNTLVYSYDQLDRKIAEYSGSVSPANELASWTYDTVAKGQPTSSIRYVGGATGVAYVNAVTSYDAMYRATGTSITIPGGTGGEATGIAGTYASTTAYNLDGTMQVQTVPAGGGLALEALIYTYNSTRQITKIQGSTGILQGALYTKDGQLQQESLGVSPTAKWVQVTNAYQDGTDRLANSMVTDNTNPTPDADVAYSYNADGNMIEANDTGGGNDDNQCFGYDGQNRIQQAWTTTSTCAAGPSIATMGGPAPYWLSWSYDANSSLRTQQINHTAAGNTETDYTYPATGTAQPHALQTTTSSVGGTVTGSYTYNTDGQTTGRPGPTGQETLGWNPDGTLASITQTGQTTSNIYDANGNLLVSHGPTTTTLYVDGEQITRVNSTGTTSCQREIDLNGQEVALRTNTGLTWLVDDPHGTTTMTIDAATQAVTHRYETPFNTPRGTAPSNWVDSNGFLDKPQDSGTGLTYVQAREYDPATGRFISVDSILTPTDVTNLTDYGYASNDPINDSDPSGLDPCSDGLWGCVWVAGCSCLFPGNGNPDQQNDPVTLVSQYPYSDYIDNSLNKQGWKNISTDTMVTTWRDGKDTETYHSASIVVAHCVEGEVCSIPSSGVDAVKCSGSDAGEVCMVARYNSKGKFVDMEEISTDGRPVTYDDSGAVASRTQVAFDGTVEGLAVIGCAAAEPCGIFEIAALAGGGDALVNSSTDHEPPDSDTNDIKNYKRTKTQTDFLNQITNSYLTNPTQQTSCGKMNVCYE